MVFAAAYITITAPANPAELRERGQIEPHSPALPECPSGTRPSNLLPLMRSATESIFT
jgi:hypothetical protein